MLLFTNSLISNRCLFFSGNDLQVHVYINRRKLNLAVKVMMKTGESMGGVELKFRTSESTGGVKLKFSKKKAMDSSKTPKMMIKKKRTHTSKVKEFEVTPTPDLRLLDTWGFYAQVIRDLASRVQNSITSSKIA